jgi:hypothetical protein
VVNDDGAVVNPDEEVEDDPVALEKTDRADA